MNHENEKHMDHQPLSCGVAWIWKYMNWRELKACVPQEFEMRGVQELERHGIVELGTQELQLFGKT